MKLLQALLNQGLDKEEALDAIDDMRYWTAHGEDPEDLLHEYGLEPDYIFELLEP